MAKQKKAQAEHFIDTAAVRPEDKIPLKEKIIYGAADIYGGGQATMIALLLMVFYTDIIGIKAAYVGTIVMLSKIWDAISDPLCGVMSDNLRSKFGRRKPFMLIGGILIIPATAFLFAPIQDLPSQAAKVAFAAVAYLVYCTVSTISQVPFMSMSADISPDYRERNKANFIKLIFDMLSAALCYLIPSMLFEKMKEGSISQGFFFTVIVFIIGAFFSAPLIVASFVVKERTPYSEEKSKFVFKEWLNSFKVKSFKYHIMMYIGAYLCMDIISALALYYSDNIMRGTSLVLFGNTMAFSSAFMVAPMMVTAGIMCFVLNVVIQKRPKQFAFRIGMPFYIIGAVLLTVYQTNWTPWLVPVATILIGIGLGGGQMMPWIIFPDTIDVAELKLGYRPTGNFSGVMTFSRKMATAVALQLVGIVLTAAGYKESVAGKVLDQPASALLAIRVVMLVSVVLLISMGVYASFKYKVTNKKLVTIRRYNEMAAEGRLDELTAEERIERIKLMKELT